MKQAEALTVGIIVLGAIDNWLVAEIIPVPVWVTFIAWASFFILGGSCTVLFAVNVRHRSAY